MNAQNALLTRLFGEPPRLRTGHDPDGERHATWLELFFDLVLVVGIAGLTRTLVDNHSLTGFCQVAGLFLPVYVAWQGFSLYSDRFDNDDLIHRFALFGGMFAVGTMAVQMKSVVAGDGFVFAVAYIVLRLLTILLYVRANFHNPSTRPLLSRYILAYTVSIAFWLASLCVGAPVCYLLWAIGISFDLGVPPLSLRQIRQTPISTSHISERFGLFVLLVMGEAVVAVTLGMAQGISGVSIVEISALGLMLAAGLWWAYFDDGQELELLPGSTAVLFAYLHIPLLFALTVIGAGVHLVIEAVGAGEVSLDPGTRWALGGGVSLFLLSLSGIQREQKRGAPPTFWLRPAFVLCLLVMTYLLPDLSPLGFTGLVTGGVVLLVTAEGVYKAFRDSPPGRPAD